MPTADTVAVAAVASATVVVWRWLLNATAPEPAPTALLMAGFVALLAIRFLAARRAEY